MTGGVRAKLGERPQSYDDSCSEEALGRVVDAILSAFTMRGDGSGLHSVVMDNRGIFDLSSEMKDCRLWQRYGDQVCQRVDISSHWWRPVFWDKGKSCDLIENMFALSESESLLGPMVLVRELENGRFELVGILTRKQNVGYDE